VGRVGVFPSSGPTAWGAWAPGPVYWGRLLGLVCHKPQMGAPADGARSDGSHRERGLDHQRRTELAGPLGDLAKTALPGRGALLVLPVLRPARQLIAR
jgi:hypothetical protein